MKIREAIKRSKGTRTIVETPPAAKLYTELHNLPFLVFEACIVDHNLNALVIEGEPTELDLIVAWETILDQYEDEIELSLEDRLMLQLQKEVAQGRQRIERAKKIADILRVCYVKELVQDLEKMAGVSAGRFKYYKWDYTDLTSYQKDLESCLRRITVDLHLKRRESELEARLKKQEKQEVFTPTRSYYTKIFLNISTYKGYHVSKKDVTAGEFCQLVNELNKYAEEMKTKAKK